MEIEFCLHDVSVQLNSIPQFNDGIIENLQRQKKIWTVRQRRNGYPRQIEHPNSKIWCSRVSWFGAKNKCRGNYGRRECKQLFETFWGRKKHSRALVSYISQIKEVDFYPEKERNWRYNPRKMYEFNFQNRADVT